MRVSGGTSRFLRVKTDHAGSRCRRSRHCGEQKGGGANRLGSRAGNAAKSRWSVRRSFRRPELGRTREAEKGARNMAAARGQITRARGGEQRTVYFSDVFGIWEEEGVLHLTLQRGEQNVHFNIRPEDGAIYGVMRLLYQYGLGLCTSRNQVSESH